MNKLTAIEKKDYINLINKYREKFKIIYNKYPIIFEHGSSTSNSSNSASSIVHAHSHIVNHKFNNEATLIRNVGFKKCSFNTLQTENANYIYYINNRNQEYISYNFEPISQLMRIYISKDLNLSNKYD